MAEGTSPWERMNLAGDQVVRTLKTLVAQGNVRRIVVRNASGRVLLDVPLTAGALGAALAPTWVLLGALAGYVGGLSVELEKKQPPETPTSADEVEAGTPPPP